MYAISSPPGAGLNFLIHNYTKNNIPYQFIETRKVGFPFNKESNEYYKLPNTIFNAIDFFYQNLYHDNITLQKFDQIIDNDWETIKFRDKKLLDNIQNYKFNFLNTKLIISGHYPPYALARILNKNFDEQITINFTNDSKIWVDVLVFIKKHMATKIYGENSIIQNGTYNFIYIINAINFIMRSLVDLQDISVLDIIKSAVDDQKNYFVNLSTTNKKLIEGSNFSFALIFYSIISNKDIDDELLYNFIAKIEQTPQGTSCISSDFFPNKDKLHELNLLENIAKKNFNTNYEDLFFTLNIDKDCFLFKNTDHNDIKNYSLKNLELVSKYLPLFKYTSCIKNLTEIHTKYKTIINSI